MLDGAPAALKKREGTHEEAKGSVEMKEVDM